MLGLELYYAEKEGDQGVCIREQLISQGVLMMVVATSGKKAATRLPDQFAGMVMRPG